MRFFSVETERTSIGKAIFGFFNEVLEEIGFFVKLAVIACLIFAGGAYIAFDISLLTAIIIGCGIMFAFLVLMCFSQ